MVTVKKTLNRAPIKRVKKALLQQVLKIPEKVKVLFSINTKEIYEMIVHIPISLKLLFNFSK